MSYSTAVVTNDPAPSTTLMNAIESALTAHPAWEFVEETVVETVYGPYPYRIWKNLGTENNWGQDFYVYFGRSTNLNLGTSNIFYGAMEGWDSTNKKIIRGCPQTGRSSGSTFTADASYHSIPAYTDVNLPNQASVYPFISTSTTTFIYRIFVNTNRISLWTSGGDSDSYVGLFEPLWKDIPTEFPLVVAGNGSSYGTSSSSFSRCPFRGSVTTRRMPGTYAGDSSFRFDSQGTYYPGYGTLGSTYNGLQNGVMGARPVLTDSYVAGYGTGIRGHAYGVLIFQAPAGYVAGDTITVDGIQHVKLSGSAWYSVED